MDHNDYRKWVAENRNYPHQHTSKDEMLTHFALGLTGESGEVADYIKKKAFGHNPERLKRYEGLLGELGDVFWYMNAIMATEDITLDEIMEYNVKKLSEKYGGNISCPK